MEAQKNQSLSEFISSYGKFVQTNFRWMADGENTPSLEERKILLQRLGNGMYGLEGVINDLKKSMGGSAFFSTGLDLADYIRDELRSPIQDFASGNIPRDPDTIEYELKDSMRPKLNQMAEEFHTYQNYTRLLELQLRYTTLYRRLEQWLGGKALNQVQDTHLKVDALTKI